MFINRYIDKEDIYIYIYIQLHTDGAGGFYAY